MTPNTIEFRSTPNNTWVLRITADRRIEVNEDVEVTDAAQKVLEAMQHLLPQRTWVGLDHHDKKTFSSWLDHKSDDEVFQAIEAKLKELNT